MEHKDFLVIIHSRISSYNTFGTYLSINNSTSIKSTNQENYSLKNSNVGIQKTFKNVIVPIFSQNSNNQ